MILPALPIGFGLVAVTALAAIAARRTALPPSIFLVLVGLGIGFVPGMPRIALRPDLVLTLLLPPLLYSAGVGMSWKGFRAQSAAHSAAGGGLCAVHRRLGGGGGALSSRSAAGRWALCWARWCRRPTRWRPWRSPSDLPIPNRVLIILEGEGLVNDATALILFSFAVAAVIEGGQFSPAAALGSFAAIVVGEIALGHVGRLGRHWSCAAGARAAGGDRAGDAHALCRFLGAGKPGRLRRAGHRDRGPVRQLERPALHFARHAPARLFRLGSDRLSHRRRDLPADRIAGAGDRGLTG